MAEFPLAGVPVDKYGDAKTDKGRRSLLAMEEEEDGPSPLAMGLLQLGASMMRDEGWRDRPITLGESLGKAIPHGITGYYNQDMLNRQEEQGRSAERDELELEEEAKLQAIDEKDEKVKQYKAFASNLDSIPDAAFAVGGDPQRATNRRENLKQMWLRNPEEAMKKMEDIWKKHEEKANATPKAKTYSELRSEQEQTILEKRREGVASLVAEVAGTDSIPQHEIDTFVAKYGNPDTLTNEDLKSVNGDYSKLMGTKKGRDYSSELQKSYDWLKQPENWETFSKREKQKIEYAAQAGDPKEALATINKMMADRKYEGEWDLIDSEVVTRMGREVTIKKMKNFSTGEQRTVEEDGPLTTFKQSMTGGQIQKKFPDQFEGVKFDPNKVYNIGVRNGVAHLTGGIVDLTPSKAEEYANGMRKNALAMDLISEEDSKLLMSSPPEDQIRIINQILLNGKNRAPKDPNSGLIYSGAELNKNLDPSGKKAVYKTASNYYWDGRKWTDIAEGDSAERFGQEESLRKEYDKNTTKFKSSLFAYNSIIKGYENSLQDPHAAGINDIMIVRAFLLMIEPNSVVRESEFASAAKAQGVYNYTLNMIEKMKNGAILTQDSRARFYNAARAYMAAVKAGHKIQVDRYSAIAKSYDLSAGRIVDDPFSASAGLENYEPYTMKDEDWKYLKDVKLITPEGNSGSQKRDSGEGDATFIRK